MNKIPSFQKDHDKLQPGLHFSGVQKGVLTLDLRFKKPNAGDFIAQGALHSVEHMMATALRNGEKKEHVLYFGPMGCRTGFYLLTEGLAYRETREAVLLAIVACLGMDEVPGSHREECGNYLEHDLAGAKTELTRYLALLHGQSEDEIAFEAGLAAEAGA